MYQNHEELQCDYYMDYLKVTRKTICWSKHELCKLEARVDKEYGIKVRPMQLYKAKKKANEDNKRNHARSYESLPLCCHLIKQCNLGTIIETIFEKTVFLYFNAMKNRSMRGCQPWFGINLCHLKGPFRGILWSIIAIDRNQRMFPFVVAMVEMESKDS